MKNVIISELFIDKYNLFLDRLLEALFIFCIMGLTITIPLTIGFAYDKSDFNIENREKSVENLEEIDPRTALPIKIPVENSDIPVHFYDLEY